MTDSTPRAGGTHKRPKDDGHRNYPRADDCPDAATHTPHPTGYLAHCEWMDEKAKTHRQRRCPTCLFWAIWEPTSADKSWANAERAVVGDVTDGAYVVGDKVQDPKTQMVGEVTDWWRDDRGQWLHVRWDESAVQAVEVRPYDAAADTGHTSHSCDCGHPWDSHMAVVGGCSTCACMAHPPNQPEAPA